MKDDSMQEAWDKWCGHVRKTLGGNIMFDETDVKTGSMNDWVIWASSGILYNFDPQEAVNFYQANKGDIDWEVSKYDKFPESKTKEAKA